jgi:cell division transport system permease protein
MINLRYIAEETFSSLRKNLVLAVAAIAVVAVSLGMLGLVVLGVNIFSNTIKNTERKVQEVDIYLSDLTSEQERIMMDTYIRGLPEVDPTQVVYKSKADALQDFKNQHPDNPELWEYLEENPLPASFVVITRDPKDVAAVADRIRNEAPFKERIEQVKTASSVIAKLESVYEKFRYVGFLAVGVLAIIAILLVSVTIQVAIFARRREIGVMKLVGATNWFIRWPFLTEGMLEGLAGSIIAIAVVFIVKTWLWDPLQENLAFLRMTMSNSLIWVLVPVIIISGILIGGIGSFVALRRFLEV